jgi:hypothetical protein
VKSENKGDLHRPPTSVVGSGFYVKSGFCLPFPLSGSGLDFLWVINTVCGIFNPVYCRSKTGIFQSKKFVHYVSNVYFFFRENLFGVRFKVLTAVPIKSIAF